MGQQDRIHQSERSESDAEERDDRAYQRDQKLETDPGGHRNTERVRKRKRKQKRRSHQPIYTRRRRTAIRRRVCVFLALVIGGLLAFGFIRVRSYYLGEEFLADLEARLEDESGLDLKIEGLSWAGREVVIDRITLNDSMARLGMVRELELGMVRATVPLTAWMQRQWEVTDVKVGNTTLRLELPERAYAPGEEALAESSEQAGSSGRETALVFGVISADKVSIDVGGELILNQGAVVIRKTKGQGDFQVTIKGGLLEGPASLPPLRLRSGSAFLSGGVLKIHQSSCSFAGGSEEVGSETSGKLEGTVDCFDGKTSLTFNFRGEDVGALLAPEWSARLSGMLDGEFSYQSTLRAGDGRLSGDFALKKARYRSHPTLQRIAEATGDIALTDIRFDRVITGHLLLTKQGGHINALDVDQRGVLAIRGDLSWEKSKQGENPTQGGPAIDATLRIGLAPDTVQKFPGGRPACFSPEGKGNFSWTEVQLKSAPEGLRDSLLPKLEQLGMVPGTQEPEG